MNDRTLVMIFALAVGALISAPLMVADDGLSEEEAQRDISQLELIDELSELKGSMMLSIYLQDGIEAVVLLEDMIGLDERIGSFL